MPRHTKTGFDKFFGSIAAAAELRRRGIGHGVHDGQQHGPNIFALCRAKVQHTPSHAADARAIRAIGGRLDAT
jgi:hypothetical protein